MGYVEHLVGRLGSGYDKLTYHHVLARVHCGSTVERSTSMGRVGLGLVQHLVGRVGSGQLLVVHSGSYWVGSSIW